MTPLSLLLSLLGGTILGADLPADFTLSPPPGPFVGATVPAGSQAKGFSPGEPIIATSYFYWYDNTTKAHVVNFDGSDALTDHPPTLDGFSFKNVDWHEQQLEDMMAAGIDVAIPVYWGEPSTNAGWSNQGLPPLVAARKRLVAAGKSPPAIGLFYDTSTLRHNARGYHVDLTTPAGRLWFYGTIRNFFSLVPPEHRALIEGKPLVFLYASAFAKHVDAKLFPELRKMFRRDFGTDLFLVKMRGWPGEADSVYQWGGALNPQILQTAAIGPGYDHSAVPGRTPLVRRRMGGRFYQYAWEKLLAIAPPQRPWLVHLETWNELHEGTDLCRTKEYGRQYIELSRRYADVFHARGSIAPDQRLPRAEVVFAVPESGEPSKTGAPSQPQTGGPLFAQSDTGLRLVPQPKGDGPVVEKTIAGRPAWCTTENRHGPRNRYLYFDADYMFLDDGDETLEVTIDYFDDGPDGFAFEYDSADPTRQGKQKAFRGGHVQPIHHTRAWKQVTFTIPHARFAGQANGGDFRLGCVDKDLAIGRVALRRVGR